MTGTVSPLPPLYKQGDDIKDPAVCAAVDVPDERLVLGEGNAVKGVFIYLNKAPKGGKPLAAPAGPFMFDQKNCRFFPHCVVIPVGQEVKVLSDDTIAHNTHTNPKKNPSVNAGVSPGDREGKLSFTYRKTESVPLSITCDYHTWMKAYQLPVDHPYAAVTDENGAFTIAELPPGKHAFVVWHEAADGGFVERKFVVEIKSGETTEMQIDYPADRLKL
jgi:plastocyanin